MRLLQKTARESLLRALPSCCKILSMSHIDRRRARINDFALYIAISGAVIAFFWACLVNGVSFEWIVVWIATAFVFVSLIVVNRRRLSPSFCVYFALALVLHVLCLPSAAAGLSRLGHSAGRVLSVGSFLEYLALRAAGEFIVPRMSRWKV